MLAFFNFDMGRNRLRMIILTRDSMEHNDKKGLYKITDYKSPQRFYKH